MSRSMSRTFWHRAAASALAAALVVASAPAAFAQAPGVGPRQGRMGRMGGPAGDLGFNLRQLNLTDAQRDQVRAIRERHQEELQSIRERTRTAQSALHKAVTAETVDETAIRTASATLADVQADGAILRAKVRQEIFGVLTPEQRNQAKLLQAQRHERMQLMRQQRQQRFKQQPPANPGL